VNCCRETFRGQFGGRDSDVMPDGANEAPSPELLEGPTAFPPTTAKAPHFHTKGA
jgi:hypothetical protein